MRLSGTVALMFVLPKEPVDIAGFVQNHLWLEIMLFGTVVFSDCVNASALCYYLWRDKSHCRR